MEGLKCERCGSDDGEKTMVALKDKSCLLCIVCEECRLILKNIDPKKIIW